MVYLNSIISLFLVQLLLKYSRGRLDPTIKNNCHIGHRKKIEPPAPKCMVSSRPSWSTTGYFGIIMHKRSVKRNTVYKLQRKKEGKWCLQVYAHHILVFSPPNCHMHHVECELKKFSAPSKNQKIKIWPTIIVRLHFLCINCWIKRVVKKTWSSWKDSRRSLLRIVGCRRPLP